MPKEKDVQPIRNQQQLEDMKWALQRHCSERDYILFVVGCETGLRVGDLLKLTTKQIHTIRFSGSRKAKRKKFAICISRIASKRSLRTPKTSRVPIYSRLWRANTPFTPTQAYRQLNKAAEFAGVEHVGNHTLRKTFGYWFYKATKDIAMLQRILHLPIPPLPCVISALRKRKRTTFWKHLVFFIKIKGIFAGDFFNEWKRAANLLEGDFKRLEN